MKFNDQVCVTLEEMCTAENSKVLPRREKYRSHEYVIYLQLKTKEVVGIA
jgi:hypothetical protein